MGPETASWRKCLHAEWRSSEVCCSCHLPNAVLHSGNRIYHSSLWNNDCPVYKKSRKHSSFFDFRSQWWICSWLTACDFWRMLFLSPFQGEASKLILQGPSKDLMLHVLLSFSLTFVVFLSVLLFLLVFFFLFFVFTVKLAFLV